MIARLVQRGLVTISWGSVISDALASGEAGQISYATAESLVSANSADISWVSTSTTTGSGTLSGASWAAEACKADFFALDIAGLQLASGPLNLTGTSEGQIAAPPAWPEGNTATYGVSSIVYAKSSLADVTVDAITVEDKLSSVSISVTSAVGGVTGADTFTTGGAGVDRIALGAGDDWAFGGGANDTILLGEGYNTAYGQAGNDTMRAGTGDDWVFGGDGKDVIAAGEGDNLVYGGAGDDTITAGSGSDSVCDGAGNDRVDAGGGANTFLMGTSGSRGDGNDTYAGGSDADWWFVNGPFGVDTVMGFSVSQGDRLVMAEGDWSTEQALRDRNGGTIFLERPSADPRDLVLKVVNGAATSSLTLDGFFTLNQDPSFAEVPVGRPLDDDQALPLLRALVSGGSGPEAVARLQPFALGDFLSNLA